MDLCAAPQNLRIILYAIIHRGGRRNGRGEERITLARRKLGMARVPKNNKARPLEKIGKMGGGRRRVWKESREVFGSQPTARNFGLFVIGNRPRKLVWNSRGYGMYWQSDFAPFPSCGSCGEGRGGGQSPCFLPPPDFLRLFSEWGDRNRDETRRFSAVFFQNFYPPCSGGGGNSQVGAQVSYCLGAQVFMGGRWGNTVP